MTLVARCATSAVRRALLVIATVSMPDTVEAFCGTTAILLPPDVSAVTMVGASADAGGCKINEAGLRVLLRLAPLQDPKLLG